MPPRFLDTNIFLRYFTRDDVEKAQQALLLLQRVERGEERVETSLIVVFEVVFTLERFYKVPRDRIRGLLLPILAMHGLRLLEKDLIQQALDQYAITRSGISFADVYNALYARSRGLTEVYSWDTDFDELPGVTRVAPGSDLT